MRSIASLRANETWSGWRRQPCRCEKAPVTIQHRESLPTDSRLRVVAVYEISAASRQTHCQRIVREETDHTRGKRFDGVGNQKMLARCRSDAFTTDAGRHRRHASRQRVKNLYTHAAAGTEWNDHGSAAMEIRFDIGNVPGERDAVHRLAGAASWHIRAADDSEMGGGYVRSDGRKNIVDEILN